MIMKSGNLKRSFFHNFVSKMEKFEGTYFVTEMTKIEGEILLPVPKIRKIKRKF